MGGVAAPHPDPGEHPIPIPLVSQRRWQLPDPEQVGIGGAEAVGGPGAQARGAFSSGGGEPQAQAAAAAEGFGAVVHHLQRHVERPVDLGVLAPKATGGDLPLQRPAHRRGTGIGAAVMVGGAAEGRIHPHPQAEHLPSQGEAQPFQILLTVGGCDQGRRHQQGQPEPAVHRLVGADRGRQQSLLHGRKWSSPVGVACPEPHGVGAQPQVCLQKGSQIAQHGGSARPGSLQLDLLAGRQGLLDPRLQLQRQHGDLLNGLKSHRPGGEPQARLEGAPGNQHRPCFLAGQFQLHQGRGHLGRPRGKTQQLQEGQPRRLRHPVEALQQGLAQVGKQFEQRDARIARVVIRPFRCVHRNAAHQVVPQVLVSAIIQPWRSQAHGAPSCR